ncbi:hypothetical protein RD792_011736 [Penstemon davidsonii]|uniref:NB-ARC domain-containing protein n=1 Tax=Penstemon davidsonii TaxID=160366 RepID=A0ABR0CVV1_9LAMI|nr:hypothetical protein RD792_011736 [Penstemon davidsonii]
MRLQEIMTIYDIKVLDMKKDFSGEVPTQCMRTPTTMITDIVVGFEDERTNILNDLVGGSKYQQIISIFGMPGLGKTTIARELYNSRLTLDHFDRHIWCVVSETYQKRNVLIDIWMSLMEKENKNNFVKMDNESLALEIHKSLKGRRFLIIMDDVWCSNVWDDLRRYFPDDGNGSRIVFTSRIRDTTPTNSIVHSLPLLTEDQCWRLLEKKVFPQEPCPLELQGIGKRIAAKCCGLPLAVVVTAGVLTKLEKKKNAWEKVETNLNSYMFDDDTNNYSKILELSFKHLPDHLKMCFLYFGVFPEDTPIPVNKLIWLWIAEGFIQREQERSPELVAEEYLSDLINRSLVFIADRKSDGGIKACNIHDLLRDMCLRKAHEEIFSKSVDDCWSLYEKHHRMFVHSVASGGGRSCDPYYRSFSGHLSHSSSKIPQIKLHRVMNLRANSDSSYELKRVDLLVQLRLALGGDVDYREIAKPSCSQITPPCLCGRGMGDKRWNLKEIPREIGEILTLQKIEVYYSGYEVYKSAVQIEQEQRENGNEELEDVSFSMPLCHSKVEEVTAEDLVELSEIAKHNLGQTRATETLTGVDNSPQSLLMFTGNKNIHGLYDFLLNYRVFLSSLTGDDVPVLYSPVPFDNAALSAPEASPIMTTICITYMFTSLETASTLTPSDFKYKSLKMKCFKTKSTSIGLNVGLGIAKDQTTEENGLPFGILNS